MNENSIVFGAPGIEPRWTSSAKDGIWFMLSHGIVNEIYFSTVDTPIRATCFTKSYTRSRTRRFTSSPTSTARAAIASSKKSSWTRTRRCC
jgi:hypothetical protein